MKVMDKNGKIANITVRRWEGSDWGMDVSGELLADIYSEEESQRMGEPVAVGDIEGVVEYLTTPVDQGGAGCFRFEYALCWRDPSDRDFIVFVD
jgi:hypothetical protein